MDIPPWVAGYIGIPFLSCGRTIDGCDCYGLVRLVLRERFGLFLPLLSADYSDANNVAETSSLLNTQLPLIAGDRLDAPELGAVALIRFRGQPSHVGVFVSADSILHTLPKVDAHLSRIRSGALLGGLEGIYRVRSCYRTDQSV